MAERAMLCIVHSNFGVENSSRGTQQVQDLEMPFDFKRQEHKCQQLVYTSLMGCSITLPPTNARWRRLIQHMSDKTF